MDTPLKTEIDLEETLLPNCGLIFIKFWRRLRDEPVYEEIFQDLNPDFSPRFPLILIKPRSTVK
jgi:hypothetical protein